MSFNLRTIVLFGLGLLLVGALATTAFRNDPISVDLAEVSRGTMVVTVDAEGKTRVREIYDISAPITGRLLRMPLSVGDPVTEGETVVAEVEPISSPLLDTRSRAEAVAVLREAEAQIRYAEAEVLRTGTDVTYAQTQIDRTRALVETGAASLTRLEDADLRLSLAKAQAVSAEAGLAMALASKERAEAVLAEPDAAPSEVVCCKRLISPANGVVLSQNNVSARPVVSGETLLSVGDPRDLEVVVDLLSSDATRLSPGAAVELDRWGGDAPLEARLRRIEPSARTVISALGIEEQRVDAVLDIISAPEDWDGLGHGFAVFVRIEEWRQDGVLLVPLSSIFRSDDTWFAFVANDGVVERRAIEIGRRDGTMAIVEGGLAEGDRVVSHPPDGIVDGSAIVERDCCSDL